jgi:hypothetical protein
MSERICQRPGCGNLIRSSRRRDTRWCSRSCEGKARRAANQKAEFEDKYGAVAELLPVEDQSLAELHERARPPRHPASLDAGRVDHDLREFSDEHGDEHLDDEDYGEVPAWAGQDEPQRTTRGTWKRWRLYGKRHGTEHPEQAHERIERQHAEAAVRMARIDAGTAGRVQDRFDPRTAPNVASSARQSRALNARYVDQPRMPAPRFDFQGESVSGGSYGYGRASGQRPGRTGHAWNTEDGFRY